MNNLKERGGVVESEGEEEERDYDRGLDMLNSIKGKSKNSIRVNNRLFGDLQMNLQKQEELLVMPEDLKLDLEPKNSMASSSHRGSFLSKAQNIKKQRGLEAEVNLEEYERKAQQKAKKSIAKLVSSMANQDLHDDLEVEVRIPTVSRGKSSDLINNAVFLKQQASKRESIDSQQ